MGQGTWRLTGLENPVSFDLDNDGFVERMGWTAPNSSLAFIATDTNHNGRIDDGSELYGTGSPMRGGGLAVNGFAALEQYDENHDHVINAADSIWNSLLLWTDLNHDGISQAHEIVPIRSGEISDLELDYRTIGRRDEHGNVFRYQAHARVRNKRQPFYDIFFSAEP